MLDYLACLLRQVSTLPCYSKTKIQFTLRNLQNGSFRGQCLEPGQVIRQAPNLTPHSDCTPQRLRSHAKQHSLVASLSNHTKHSCYRPRYFSLLHL